jgi:hypothetical protein
VTVTGTLAVPFAATENVPLDGVTLTPAVAFAVQVTVCAVEAEDWTDNVAEAVAPGLSTADDGETDAVSANTGPYDGGASAAAVPQVDGWVPRVKARVAPLAARLEYEVYSLSYAAPLSFSDW